MRVIVRRVAPAIVLCAALVASGCGSTVQITRGSAGGTAGASAGDGLALGAEQPATTDRASVPRARASGKTAEPGSMGGVEGRPATEPNGSVPPSGSPSLPPTGATGPGFTAKEIFIGVAYDSTFSQELGAAGVSPGAATVGDQRAQINAITNDINARGGIAGRRLVPVFYDTRGLNNQNDPNTIAQAACTRWTQDTRVFAAMTYVVQMDNETLYRCLSKNRVIFVPLGGESSAMFSKYAPHLWSPPGVAIERIPPMWIARLTAMKYFTAWDTTFGRAGTAPVKIGLLYGNGIRNNQPELDKAFVRSTTQALDRRNRKVTATFEITNDTADLSAAVLAFKSAGITHVVGDYSLVNFTQAAESQRYRPRYGYTSFSPGIAFNLFAPKSQLNGALGVGWIPAGDVENAQDPGDTSAAAAHCRKVMNAAGQPTEARLAWFAMTWACDTFNFFVATIKPAKMSPAWVRATATALGSLPPAATFRIAFPQGRTDGVGAVRDVGFRGDCGCFAYLNKTNRTI